MASSTFNCRGKNSLVMKLNPNDVLMGRGAKIDNNEGNKRFRELIRQRKDEYIATNRHPAKHEISVQIYEMIGQKGGSFLRKIEDSTEAHKLNIVNNTEAWVLVSKEVALKKVKQALRGHDKSSRPDNLSRTLREVTEKAPPATGISNVTRAEKKLRISNINPPQVPLHRENHIYGSIINPDYSLPWVQGAQFTNYEKSLLLQRLINAQRQDDNVSPSHKFQNLQPPYFAPSSFLSVQSNLNHMSTPRNIPLQEVLDTNIAEAILALYRDKAPLNPSFPTGPKSHVGKQSQRTQESHRMLSPTTINDLVRMVSLRQQTESILLAQLLMQAQTSITLDRIGGSNGGFGLIRSHPLMNDITIEPAQLGAFQVESSISANASFVLTKQQSDVAYSQSFSPSSSDTGTDNSPKSKKFKSN